METLQIRDAKASFSALVAAAEKRHPTLVSRHGQPCAMTCLCQMGRACTRWRFPIWPMTCWCNCLVELMDSAC